MHALQEANHKERSSHRVKNLFNYAEGHAGKCQSG